MLETDAIGGVLASRNSVAGPAHDDKKIHTKNADSWVILDAQVNVFRDTETKVASIGEVALP